MTTTPAKAPWPERFSAFIKTKEFNIGIAIFFSIVVSALIAYGVLSHKEPGYMTVTPGWERSQFPLQVCAIAYADRTICNPTGMVCDDSGLNLSCDALEVVTDAVKATNTRLGFEALEVAGDHCQITATIGVPVEHGSLGNPNSGWTDAGGNAFIRPGSVAIETANVHGELRDLVLQHELGHALSLDHDSYPQSIMFGGEGNDLAPTPAGQIPPWISDSDRELLRHDFGPQE